MPKNQMDGGMRSYTRLYMVRRLDPGSSLRIDYADWKKWFESGKYHSEAPKGL
jgi:hypothetical protein